MKPTEDFSTSIYCSRFSLRSSSVVPTQYVNDNDTRDMSSV